MPTKHRNNTPKYCLHKPTHQGTVTLNGKRLYLGRYDNPATREKYHRLIAEWLANGRSLPAPPEEITIIELCNLYWKWCSKAYPPKNGRLSSTCFRTKSVIETVAYLYGSTKADNFSPKCLKVLQLKWAEQKLVRKTVNEYTAIARRIFRWGVSEGIIESGVYITGLWPLKDCVRGTQRP